MIAKSDGDEPDLTGTDGTDHRVSPSVIDCSPDGLGGIGNAPPFSS
jgi:hypothetical protein